MASPITRKLAKSARQMAASRISWAALEGGSWVLTSSAAMAK